MIFMESRYNVFTALLIYFILVSYNGKVNRSRLHRGWSYEARETPDNLKFGALKSSRTVQQHNELIVK